MKKKSSNDELYYSARDLAYILNGFELDCQREAETIERIWEKERSFLQERYRSDKRKLLLDILYWERYEEEKAVLNAELQVVKMDVRDSGGHLAEGDYSGDFEKIDLFFKEARLRILYGPGVNYVCAKRKTLVALYAYQRFSAPLKTRIQNCLAFYHLATYKRGGVPCRIEDTKPNDTVVFRVAAEKTDGHTKTQRLAK